MRLVLEHQAERDSQWSAITPVASKLGCTAETLREWYAKPAVTLATRMPVVPSSLKLPAGSSVTVWIHTPSQPMRIEDRRNNPVLRRAGEVSTISSWWHGWWSALPCEARSA